MSFENFPYTNFHDLNLDWIIKKIQECYSPDNPPESMVISVNGESGIVTLYENAVIQFPSVEENTWTLFRLSNNTETGIQFIKGQKAQRIDSINRYDIYDQGNPPPYPVTNVGGLTGAVAILGTTIVTDGGTQKLQVLFPVSSVDGMTGAVRTWGNNSAKTLKPPVAAEGDGWAIARDIPSGSVGIEFEYDDNTNKTTGYLVFDDGTPPLNKVKLLTLDDIPSSSGVVSINAKTGVVTIYGTDIDLDDHTGTKVSTAINNNTIAINNKTAKSVITTTWETGGVATQNYAIGDCIQIGNDLYEATANISIGDTFSGSNTIRITVGEKLTDLSNKSVWNFGGNVTGNTVLQLPYSTWKELYIVFYVFGDTKLAIPFNISRNQGREEHYTAVGYLSQEEITAHGWSLTPCLLWVDLYSYGADLVMMATNSEVSLPNWQMFVWYK